MLHEVKKQVESILKRFPETREDDKKLQVRILKDFYGVDKIEDILKPDIPSLESIRRCRQKLQSEGKYPSTKETKKIREHQEGAYWKLAKTKE